MFYFVLPFIYYNTNKNKTGTDTILYKCPNTMIEQMEKQIKTKQYFIACFDSLKQMNKIIEHLSQFGNKEEWLIYSSEVDYDLIDTSDSRKLFEYSCNTESRKFNEKNINFNISTWYANNFLLRYEYPINEGEENPR